jgi:hypothetical protein
MPAREEVGDVGCEVHEVCRSWDLVRIRGTLTDEACLKRKRLEPESLNRDRDSFTNHFEMQVCRNPGGDES